MRTVTLVHIYTKGTHMQNGRHRGNGTHQINTAHNCGRASHAATTGVRDEDLAAALALPESQNTAEVCLRVREGIGSLSKYPHT